MGVDYSCIECRIYGRFNVPGVWEWSTCPIDEGFRPYCGECIKEVLASHPGTTARVIFELIVLEKVRKHGRDV